MKILQVHVHHLNAGGSEVLFAGLVALLRMRGHEVVTLERHNAEISGFRGRFGAAMGGIYSRQAKREMAALLTRERPDVVHLHNVYALLSPSIVVACNEAGVPVVMSLHDYKLVCPTAQFFRAGAPCHRCSGGREYNCLLTNCRRSWPESAAYAVRATAARRAGWFIRGVDRFIACSDFVRVRHVAEGFPADRVVAIPNFAEIPALPPPRGDGSYAAFLGRISPEKGVELLMQAARITSIPVQVAGAHAVSARALEPAPTVRFVGPLAREEVPSFLGGARFLVVPTLCEEPFGIVAAEAMGYGLPVIASRTGGLAGIVEDGVTGLLFEVGNLGALTAAMLRLWHDPALARRLGVAGREKAEKEYTRETYCDRLEQIYASVMRDCPVGAGTA